MRTTKINNTSFLSKQPCLNKEQLKNFNAIKDRIGKDSFIISGKDFYQTHIGYLRTNDVFLLNTAPTEVLLGESKLIIHNDGKISISEKPFFKSKKRLIKLLGEYLAIFNKYFFNNNIVEIKRISMSGYIDKNDGKGHITEKEWI